MSRREGTSNSQSHHHNEVLSRSFLLLLLCGRYSNKFYISCQISKLFKTMSLQQLLNQPLISNVGHHPNLSDVGRRLVTMVKGLQSLGPEPNRGHVEKKERECLYIINLLKLKPPYAAKVTAKPYLVGNIIS